MNVVFTNFVNSISNKSQQIHAFCEIKNKLLVESSFDLYFSTRLEFSISIFQFDSKPDSSRIVKKSNIDSDRVESSYSTRSVKNSIF